jgi:hypothetical protein
LIEGQSKARFDTQLVDDVAMAIVALELGQLADYSAPARHLFREGDRLSGG